MRTYDFAPLWRSTIGFDRFFDLVDAAQHAGAEDNYRIAINGSSGSNIREIETKAA
jgi:hypothetical protein